MKQLEVTDAVKIIEKFFEDLKKNILIFILIT